VKRFILIPIALVTAVVAVVILTSGGSSNPGGNSATAAAASGGAAALITTKTGPHGTYLVDAKGRALYLFEADKANKSNCNGACLSIWPGFDATGKPPAAQGGASAAKIGVTAPGSGQAIVTYAGHPLYYYVGDKKPGDTTGQGLDQFGGGWYVVNPAGDKIDDDG
jgi:predicted lipoprotein with Yx(FWY)xxD motif